MELGGEIPSANHGHTICIHLTLPLPPTASSAKNSDVPFGPANAGDTSCVAPPVSAAIVFTAPAGMPGCISNAPRV